MATNTPSRTVAGRITVGAPLMKFGAELVPELGASARGTKGKVAIVAGPVGEGSLYRRRSIEGRGTGSGSGRMEGTMSRHGRLAELLPSIEPYLRVYSVYGSCHSVG